MEKAAQTLVFSQDFNAKDLMLFEVDEEFVQEILKGDGTLVEYRGQTPSKEYEEASIKKCDSSVLAGKSAVLSSSSRTFKLKQSETSNLLMVADLNREEAGIEAQAPIMMSTSTFVEVTPTQVKKYQIVDYLRAKFCAFRSGQDGQVEAENPLIAEEEFQNAKLIEEGASFKAILDNCQTSHSELLKLLYDNETRLRLQIIKLGGGSQETSYAFIDDRNMKDLVDSLLVLINSDEERAQGKWTCDQMLGLDEGSIPKKFRHVAVVEFGLSLICERSDDGAFSLSAQKVSKFIALALLIEKKDFQLKEFERMYDNLIQLRLPADLLTSLKESSSDKSSLFDGFGTKFGMLKSHAVLIPASHNFANISSSDDIIMHLDSFLSAEINGKALLASLKSGATSGAAALFEARLSALFQVKQKWTGVELEAYLSEWIEPEQKMATMLSRATRSIKGPNPFDPKVQTLFYTKKF